MSGEPQYTQIKRPVSRVAEKVLGWLNWIGLLFLTVITMFIALVSFSNNTSIQNLEQAINGNQFAQQILTNNSLNTTQFVIWLQNGIWAVIVYLIVCLLISFLALISMNIRVLSGILFLIASIITLPLVLLLATIVIPVLFFIVAIMMFARKDKVETVPYYPGAYGGYDDYRGSDYDDRYYDRNRQEDRRNPRYDEPAYVERNHHDEDDVKRYEPKDKTSKPSYASEQNDVYDENVSETNQPQEEDTTDQETPNFLSRQAKYKQKTADEVKEQQENDAYEREQARINAMDQEEEPEEIKYRDTEPKKGETAEEKEARKLEKKERKKRAKEARKNRPSAVNQRRMNFEERRSHQVGKSNEQEITQTSQDEANTEQQENKE